jgi:hypothetical protein
MEFKKLIMIEVGGISAVLFLVLVVVGIMPFLASSQQNSSVPVYSERTYVEGNATLTRGNIYEAPKFKYSTFDPAILIVDLNFQNWRSSGNLTVTINGKVLATVTATPQNPHIRVNAIAFSGIDLVEPNSQYAQYSSVLGNSIYFLSNPDGYEGTFTYEISIRGSR